MSATKPLLAGRYRIGAVLGSGGMAVVHAAIEETTGQEVAVKRLRPALSRGGEALARFDREARAMARIVSPHVVRILDAGIDREGPYLVMERVRGETLAECLNRSGRLSPLAVIRLGEQILAGLAAAHHAGVIHRDLKPENILMAENRTTRSFRLGGPEVLAEHVAGQELAKIADFGISRIEMVDEHTLTQSDQFVGTANYLSPEQIRKDPITHRADLWSVGVLLYQCLTGRRPFEADGVYALYSRILSEPHAPLQGIDAASAAAFEPFFRQALSKKAAARFSSAEEMRAALSKLRRAFLPAVSRTRSPSLAVFMTFAVVATIAGVAGVATGRALAKPAAEPVADTFALDVEPTAAQVLIDGVSVVDRNHVRMSSSPLHIAAAGFRARDVNIPMHGGGRLVVELVPDLPVAVTATASSEPTFRTAERAVAIVHATSSGPASPPPRRVSRPTLSPPPPPPPVASGARAAVKPITVPPY